MFDKTIEVPFAVTGELEEFCFRRAFELLDKAGGSTGATREWANDRAQILFAIGLTLQPRRLPGAHPPAGIWKPDRKI